MGGKDGLQQWDQILKLSWIKENIQISYGNVA